jgi:hypothetical protein
MSNWILGTATNDQHRKSVLYPHCMPARLFSATANESWIDGIEEWDRTSQQELLHIGYKCVRHICKIVG